MTGTKLFSTWEDHARTVERRTAARVSWLSEVHVRPGVHRIVGEGLDLCVGGLRVASPCCPPVGQSIAVAFRVSGEEIQAFGEVVWAGDSSTVWGLRFTGIHPAWLERIRGYVDTARANVPGAAVPQPAQTGHTEKISLASHSVDA